MLVMQNKQKLSKTVQLRFKATNNVAEYEALLVRLRIASVMKVTHIKLYSAFQLVVNQV